MSDNDLIRRGDALAVCAANEEKAYRQGRGDFMSHSIDGDQIAALPAVDVAGVRVTALMDTAKGAIAAMQEARSTIVSKREHALLSESILAIRAAIAEIERSDAP